jgi:uncharacterized protein (DUF2235 family)
LTGSDQTAKYDDGVGSSSFKPLALLGGALGWGLKRNAIDLYKFICRNYRRASAELPTGSQICAFGFSRGGLPPPAIDFETVDWACPCRKL